MCNKTTSPRLRGDCLLLLLITFILGFAISWLLSYEQVKQEKKQSNRNIDRFLLMESEKCLVLDMQIIRTLQTTPEKAKKIIEQDFLSNLAIIVKLTNGNQMRLNKKKILEIYNSIDREMLAKDMKKVDSGSLAAFEIMCNDIEAFLKKE